MTATLSVLEALAVTAELTNTPITPAAAKVMAGDLAGYPPHQVLGALARCRKELKGRMSVADVISRLDDGRPDAQEAWAMLPFDEDVTVVWTEEMSGAWGVALPLLMENDRIAARMAFLESYRTRVQRARDARVAREMDGELRPQRRDAPGRARRRHASRADRTRARAAARLPARAESDPRIEHIARTAAKRLTGPDE
jgi:hypothetical protein